MEVFVGVAVGLGVFVGVRVGVLVGVQVAVLVGVAVGICWMVIDVLLVAVGTVVPSAAVALLVVALLVAGAHAAVAVNRTVTVVLVPAASGPRLVQVRMLPLWLLGAGVADWKVKQPFWKVSLKGSVVIATVPVLETATL